MKRPRRQTSTATFPESKSGVMFFRLYLITDLECVYEAYFGHPIFDDTFERTQRIDFTGERREVETLWQEDL